MCMIVFTNHDDAYHSTHFCVRAGDISFNHIMRYNVSMTARVVCFFAAGGEFGP